MLLDLFQCLLLCLLQSVTIFLNFNFLLKIATWELDFLYTLKIGYSTDYQ